MADGDPIVKALQKSSIAQTLKAARASLAEPSWPYTPLDRSLFQRPNEGSEPRPSSSYGVDQVTFVRDTFGARPESARSSRSRPDTIQEEGVDILRLDQEVESSGSEELTPVQATPPPVARATSGSLGASPSGPPKPPRPPGGYPGSGSRASLGGYPDGNEKSPMRLSSSSPRRRLASLSDAPGTPGSAGRRSGSGSRRAKGEDAAARLAQALELGSVPVARAPCEVVIGRLQSLKASKDKGLDKEDFAQLCDRILTLTKEMKAGQHVDSSAQLLREIMGLMDVKDLKESKYLFKLARCALALLSVDAATAGVPISGVQAAYQNIAQVLFKYSQKEGNDAEFLSAKLIEPLIEVLESTSDSCSSTDLRVYIVGILKNVSNDSANQKLLAQRGAVTALFKLMDGKILTGTPKEVPLLIQVTASLRNLASNQYKQFLTEDHLNALTNVMATYAGHVELLTNVARILAKLTLHDKAAEALARSDVHLRQIVQTVRSNMDSLALCLRLLFVLGNLTERSDRVRTVFAFDCEGTALVPELLGKYWQKERQHAAEKSKAGSAAGASEFEEVLVKLVRLLANVAISPSAGPTLAASSAVAEPLLDMLGAKRISDSEELVLNVVAAITNLLFYDVPANLLFHEESKQLLCRLFRPLLLESYNVEALVETARALGNLSRHADARRCMASLRLDEILVILLDHDDRDLVFYSCGALVNLAADSECIPRLAGSTPAVQKLAKLLGDAPCNDPMLQLVAVKVLTNLSLDSRAAWPMEDMELVRGVLAQSIADSQEVGDDHERQQLIDLARHLQGRLPAAPDPPAPAAPADAEWFYCRAEGCGRRFGSGEKLAAHVQRRHQQDEVLE